MADWLQMLMVVLAVVLAVVWLGRRFRGIARGQVSCSHCPGCDLDGPDCDAARPPINTDRSTTDLQSGQPPSATGLD